jgi:hypothetical protein
MEAEAAVATADASRISALRTGYLAFLEDYKRAYNREPPVHLWPRPVADEVEGYAAAGCGCRCIA